MNNKILSFILIVMFCGIGNGIDQYKLCHSCNNKNVPEAEFCSKCGNKLQKNYKLGFGLGIYERGFAGFSFFIRYFFLRNYGMKINLGLYVSELNPKVYNIGTRYYTARYIFPVSFIYQKRENNIYEPLYLGIGLCYVDYKAANYMMSNHKQGSGITPFANVGIDLIPNSPLQITCDIKYFINLYLPEGSLFVVSGAIGISW